MLDTVTGFVVIGVSIAVGYLLGRINLLGEHARPVLSRLIFFVLAPFLVFTVLSEADVGALFASLLPVSAIAAVTMFLIFGVIARWLWKRDITETLIGMMSAGLVNANNIGIPLSLYLLGSAAYPAPIILTQLLVFTPLAITVFESVSSGRSSLWRSIRKTVATPIVVAAAAGTIVSVAGVELPPMVRDPAELIAHAAVPILLISYGISLYGQRVLGPSGRRRDIVLASVLKLVAMPITAWVVAEFVFNLDRANVLIVVTLAGLPTAQNVFNYAQRYEMGETIARDTVFITTIGCVPVLLMVAVLFGP